MFTKKGNKKIRNFYNSHKSLCNKLTHSDNIQVFFEFVKLAKRKKLLNVNQREKFLKHENRVQKIRSLNIYLKNTIARIQREQDHARHTRAQAFFEKDGLGIGQDLVYYVVERQ